MALSNIRGGELIILLAMLLFALLFGLGFLAVIYLIVRAVANRPPARGAQRAPDVQQRRDAEHLKLASIFHFVFGGLALLGIGFLAVHYTIMRLCESGNVEGRKGRSTASLL